jgi:TolB-like protein
MAFPLPDKPSIAVLPFTNMSGDAEQEYFVDGMTEDLITDLSKLSGLFVIARNSTFTYKGKSVKIRQVAEELGVRYVLEGSVRRAGEQVRINAQLIDATTGGHLWAERYDGSLTNVFELQDKITQKIVSALAINLTTDEETRRMRKETDSPAAYDAFLEGWTRYRLFTPDDFAKAIPHLERAIELDPNYSRAHAALAAVYGEAYYNYWVRITGLSPQVTLAGIKRHLQSAMQNPTPLAHQVASLMFIVEGHYDEAIAEAERAVTLDSNDPSGYVAMARALLLAGRPAESIEFIGQATRFDPRSDFLYWLGAAQFHLERYDEAAATMVRATEHNPDDLRSFLYLASAYGHLERQQDAESAFETYKELRAKIPALQSSASTYTSEKLGIFLFKRQAETEQLHKGLVKLGYELPPKVVEASLEGITLEKTTYTSVAQVYDAAKEHCRKHGKKSHLMNSSPPSYMFGCR